MPANSEKPHLSIVICGHVDSGKSTTTGRLIFELGGLPWAWFGEAEGGNWASLGKGSFAFAFFMDRQKGGGVSVVWPLHAPPRSSSPRSGTTPSSMPQATVTSSRTWLPGASQADVALIMVPADGNFTTAIAKGNHKAGEIQGQTRQHSRLINLLGVKQICIGSVNKMGLRHCRLQAGQVWRGCQREWRACWWKVGWKKDFIEKSTPVMPISGWMGWQPADEVWEHGLVEGVRMLRLAARPSTLTPSTMCWTRCAVCLSVLWAPPCACQSLASTRSKGVGDVLAGRVEQGVVKPGEEVVFLPTHTASNPCTGKVFTVEMHHQRVGLRQPWRQRAALNIKGLDKNNMPRSGDVMVYKKDNHPGPDQRSSMLRSRCWTSPMRSRVGYSPIGFVRCGRAACRVSASEVGRWARRLVVARRWRTLTPWSPTRWLKLQLPATAAIGLRHLQELQRASPVLPSWMATVWWCLAKVVSCERKGRRSDDKGGKKKWA